MTAQLEDNFDKNITSTEKNAIASVDTIQLFQEAKLTTTALAGNADKAQGNKQVDAMLSGFTIDSSSDTAPKGSNNLDTVQSALDRSQPVRGENSFELARANGQQIGNINQHFDIIMQRMKDIGLHSQNGGGGWADNADASHQCFKQAEFMAGAIRAFINKDPEMKGNFTVSEGTINPGKNQDYSNPISAVGTVLNNAVNFYSGGEHTIVVITDNRDGSKLYGDPWSGRKFSPNPQESIAGYKNGTVIHEHPIGTETPD